MDIVFYQMNFLAIFCAGIAFWLVGMLWFSLLFRNVWSKEIQRHGIKIKAPSSKEMIIKSLLTFILNLLVAFGIALLVPLLGIGRGISAVSFGFILGICFAGAAMGISYVWESRSLKLSLIDIGYPVIGIIVATMIIAHWR